MSRALWLIGFLLSAMLLSVSQAAAATPAPAWDVQSVAVPTNFKPSSEAGDQFYEVTLRNSGGIPSDGSDISLVDVLPEGVEVESTELELPAPEGTANLASTACEDQVVSGTTTVTCAISETLPEAEEPATLWPSEEVRLVIHVSVPGSVGGVLSNSARVEGGGAAPAAATSENPVSDQPAGPGLSVFSAAPTAVDGQEVREAGAHPYQYVTSFAVNTNVSPLGSSAPYVPAGGDLREIEVSLPPGLIGNPTAATRCTPQQFVHVQVTNVGGNALFQNECPDGSAIGLIVVQQVEGIGQILPLPVYNLVPPPGMPAQLGFEIVGAPIYINTAVRTGGDYGVTAYLKRTSEAKRVTAATLTIWGTPAEEDHDRLRGACLNSRVRFSIGSCSAGHEPEPFLRLPTSCETPLLTEMSFDTWLTPGALRHGDVEVAPLEDCQGLEFDPALVAQPQVDTADSPSGIDVAARLPQDELPEDRGVSDLRDAVVRFPAGLSVNPASANGLQACGPGDIDLHGSGPARCPDAAKIGTVEVSTPLLDHPIQGGVFVAKQEDNPFNSLLAIYIAAHDPQTGVVLKLAGKVEPDPVTGQLTTRFRDNPQLPFDELKVALFGGPRAPLRTPLGCGTYRVDSQLRPWSALDPATNATPSDTFSIAKGPAGACPDGAMAVKLAAGLGKPVAGAASPFHLRLTRQDGSGEISSVAVSLPLGFTARLRGIPYCPEPGIAQAISRAVVGGGHTELTTPSCPQASAVGTIAAGAGAGPSPFFVPGTVYLAGPYRAAPLSLVAIVPALAGPFDLGVVVDRIPLEVDPETARVTAPSDPFPTILAGIPLDLKDLRVNLDRPDFTRAPTSCEASEIQVTATGPSGVARAADPFQVGSCAALRFAPKLALHLRGGTKRGMFPALSAVLKSKPGEASIARAVVSLPPSEQIENAHVQIPCTRVQFNAGACPKKSILGHARAFTPLLDKPLEGPVYFRANGGEHLLPDIVADLRGQVHIVVVGHIDSARGRIRTTFDAVPDAPISKFALQLFGGRKGLLTNNRNICARPYKVTVSMDAHNGRARDFSTAVGNSCP